LVLVPLGSVFSSSDSIDFDLSDDAIIIGDLADWPDIIVAQGTLTVNETNTLLETRQFRLEVSELPPPILLVIDEDTIDNGLRAIKNISLKSPFCGNKNPSVCVNDDIAAPGVRELLFTGSNDITPFSGLVLSAGQVGDEGLFRFTGLDPQISQQNGASFTIQDFIFAEGAAVDENNLDKITGVVPLSAADILNLEGQTVCAVVYDSDISYDKSAGHASLKGATLGLTAFTVTAVTPGTKKTLPSITVDLLPSAEVLSTCERVL
jgi:hypothetical protein